MMQIQLVTLTFKGQPFFRYASTAEPGEANAMAGQMIDSLTDIYGGENAFGYAVRSVPFRRLASEFEAVLNLARTQFETGAWLQTGVA